MATEHNGNEHSVDNIFGQARAFSLDETEVNPDVVAYLENVRSEALRTTAASINVQERFINIQHQASMYDDQPLDKHSQDIGVINATKTEQLFFQANDIKRWMQWFEETKNCILNDSYIFRGYDEQTLNLLLYHLRCYIEKTQEKRGIIVHLLNILSEVPETSTKEDADLEFDEAWAIDTLETLKSKRIRNLQELKRFISKDDIATPIGFQKWFKFIQDHQPTHSIFTRYVDQRSLWVLVQYMTQEWIKQIYKGKKIQQTDRLKQWLLYIIIHIPQDLTAKYVSNLRELGKKCRNYMIMKDDKAALHLSIPREFSDLNVPMLEPMPGIFDLVLIVIGIKYGQQDLLQLD